MKKFLPKSVNNPQGFTLIELLIVVTIIAVLSVIGITVFGGVQKDARNARRRADIDSINKVLEVHFNQTTNQYCTAAASRYCAPKAAWFSAGVIPTDPSAGTAYATLPLDDAASYNVCANLETSPATNYCRSNQQ